MPKRRAPTLNTFASTNIRLKRYQKFPLPLEHYNTNLITHSIPSLKLSTSISTTTTTTTTTTTDPLPPLPSTPPPPHKHKSLSSCNSTSLFHPGSAYPQYPCHNPSFPACCRNSSSRNPGGLPHYAFSSRTRNSKSLGVSKDHHLTYI